MSSTKFTPPYPNLEVPATGAPATFDAQGNLVGPAQAVQFNETDITRDQKRTLRSYLSSLTSGKVPGENSGNPDPFDGQVPPNHANPFAVSESSTDQVTFGSQPGLQAAADRDSTPSSIFGNTDDIIRTGDLGKAGSTIELSGHELLPGVVGASGPGASTVTTSAGATRYVETLGTALAKKNLNHGAVISNGTSVVDDGSFTQGGATSSRVLLGDTLTGGNISRSYDPAAVKRASTDDLLRIGQSMMQRAVGSTANQTGQQRIRTRDLRAASSAASTSLRELNRTTAAAGYDDIPSGEDAGLGVYTEQSWPVAYSPDSQYDGFETLSGAFTAFVTSATFLAAVISTAVLGSFVPAIAKGLIPAEVNTGTISSARKLKSGKFRYVESSAALAGISSLIDAASNISGLSFSVPIYSPTNPLTDYPSCVIAGLASFLGVSYGIDPNLIFLGVINTNTPIITAEITARILAIFVDPASRQYYMNIIREINRDTVALGGALGSVSFAGGLQSDIGAAVSTVSNIFNSKLFKFVNALAAIGDLVYTQAAAAEFRKTEIEMDPSATYKSFNAMEKQNKDRMSGFGVRRIYGNRIKGRRGVTYSLSDLPSYHLIPSGSSQAYQKLLGSSTVAMRMKSVSAGDVDGRRFSPEQVSAIESTLDAEYMPFYFQDLRTNEIVAFHAFLEDLSDSYSANYNNTGGYGRIEEVKTYKDTKRSVGFSFHIVATNPQDFDYMWWQVNKLTSMVYPQWSKGRKLTTKINGSDFNFSQPFSQIPTATPIIRVRVGDLIRSNYSRFNLKRLFGYQDIEKNQGAPTSASVYFLAAGGKYSVKVGDPSGLFWVTPDNKIELGSTLTVDPNDDDYVIVTGSGLPLQGVSLLRWEIPSTPISRGEGENAQSFYDSTNNSVVRSFETTRGLGLAGVVTQLQFTWMDAGTLWGVGEDGPGNRAPRACKVQVSFDPIHDIAPGLDHEGFNRAPIYPVGSLVNSIVEGGEGKPYGVETLPRAIESANVTEAKKVFEDENKQGILDKLF